MAAELPGGPTPDNLEPKPGPSTIPKAIEAAPSETTLPSGEYLEEHETLPCFADLAGMTTVVEKLRDIADDYNLPQSAALYEEYDVSPPRTLLLLGPGGVGKTSATQALAKELRANFMPVASTEIIDSYVGNSAKNVRSRFNDAQQKASNGRKSLLFFDEFDAMFSQNAAGNSGVATQLVNELKLILNDLAETYPDVIVVLAANANSGISEPLLRAGRIDEVVNFAKPDREARTEILQYYLHKHSDHFHMQGLDSFLDLILEVETKYDPTEIRAKDFADLTDGLTGADLEEILSRARRQRLREERKSGTKPPKITHQQLLHVLEEYRHSRPNID